MTDELLAHPFHSLHHARMRRLSVEHAQKLRALTIVVLPLLGVCVAIVLLWNRYVFPRDLLLLGVLYTLVTLGISIGYHRMLTHEGFSCPRWLRALFIMLGCMAWEGAPIMWAATHIKHHAHSDDDDDPHTPLHGFWHAHMGWIFTARNFPDPQIYAPYLLRDPVVRWIDRLNPLWMTLSLAIPFALGGWTGLLWGGLVRIFLTTHVTWSVNSVCHTFGKRAFETTDESRNEWIVGLLAFGEGWHNNHHAFPRNAFHGMRWWQFDLSGLLIRLFEKTGLAWNVQRVMREAEEAKLAHGQALHTSLQLLREQLTTTISSLQAQLSDLLEKYGRPHITDQQVLAMVGEWEGRMARLRDIQERVTVVTHLKKRRLQEYLQEVQELALRDLTEPKNACF